MDVYFVSTASTVIAVPTFFGFIAARRPANDLRGGIVKASIQDKEGLTIAGKTSTLNVKESMLRLVLLLSGGLPIFVKTLPGKIIITEFKTLDLSAIIITIIDACLTPSSQKDARSPALTISKMLSSLPSSVPFIFVFTYARALVGSMATSTDNIQRFSFWGCENYVDQICTIGKTTTLDIETSDATDNIQAKIPNKKDIQTISQRLNLVNKQFKDDLLFHLVLSLYRDMPISEETLTGKTIPFDVSLNPSIPVQTF